MEDWRSDTMTAARSPLPRDGAGCDEQPSGVRRLRLVSPAPRDDLVAVRVLSPPTARRPLALPAAMGSVALHGSAALAVIAAVIGGSEPQGPVMEVALVPAAALEASAPPVPAAAPPRLEDALPAPDLAAPRPVEFPPAALARSAPIALPPPPVEAPPQVTPDDFLVPPRAAPPAKPKRREAAPRRQPRSGAPETPPPARRSPPTGAPGPLAADARAASGARGTLDPPPEVERLDPPVVTNPGYLHRTPPAYPRRALALGQQGMVTVRALIDVAGRPREIRIWQSSGFPLLDRAAAEAVADWIFETKRIDGRAMEAWVEVPVRFRIE